LNRNYSTTKEIPHGQARIHQPEPIAEAIFRASQSAPRELWVGFASVGAILGTMVAPGLLDKFLARKGYDGQLTSEPQGAEHADNLFAVLSHGHVTHGRFDERARRHAPAFNASVVRTTIALATIVLIFLAAILTLA
jgi:hypothetical protein